MPNQLISFYMALIKFKHKDKTWGIVRNQKCATTTIMSYVANVLWNADVNQLQYHETFEQYAPGVYIKTNDFKDYQDKLAECDVRIAVWRDPIDKFISGYYHTMFSPSGAQDGLWIGPKTLDEFLRNYDYYRTAENVKDHCETNTARLGPNKDIYTHIFHYKSVHKIADLLGVDAHDTHHRKDNTLRVGPNTIQKLRIKQIMLEDYVNNWSV